MRIRPLSVVSGGLVLVAAAAAAAGAVAAPSGPDTGSEAPVVLARAGDGPAALDADAMALSDAVMVLEAIPVYGPDGETIVGRFGARFIEEASFEAARAEAQELVVEATGKAYRSK